MLRILLLVLLAAVPARASGWTVEESPGALEFRLGGQPIATYSYRDPVITRPYFANLSSPAGVRVTRNHPPVAGVDRMDHPEYHPGVWLAFGDLSGTDNWRLHAKVEHARFVQSPEASGDRVVFAVENRYLDAADEPVCRSVAKHTLVETDRGVLLTYDVTFSGDEEFTFGDQEEMGFGVRTASILRVEERSRDGEPPGGGEMVADGGRVGSAEIWGQPAQWIDYRGEIDGRPAGVALFCHPENPRESRLHARDYGYVCANPFALAAFDAGEPATTTVEPGETLRLRYAVLLHSGEPLGDEQLEAAYHAYAEREAP